MRKAIYLSLTLFAAVATMQSCKKGENDPFLSLKSRKARLAGEWTLTASERKSTSTSTNYSSTTTSTYNGSTETSSTTIVNNGSSLTTTGTSTYTVSLVIEKDGTYKHTRTEDGETVTTEGTWIFLKRSKEDELKNKEAIMLTVKSITDSNGTITSTDINGEVISIDQLKNKEMVWVSEYSYSNSSGSDSETEKSTFTLK